MRLQKNTSLALYSVIEFAADPARHVSAAEIAGKYGVSAHHLAKVLSDLARAGIVASVRGAGGGYRFTGNARRLTLLDVVRLFEDFEPAAARREPGEATPVGVAKAWEAFLDSPFNNHDVQGKCRSHPGDIRDLLLELARRRTKAFPASELVGGEHTIEAVIQSNIKSR